MNKILYLFPDTNLFAQCRALEELDWERWGQFDEIHLVVSRPIQSEIDNHKNKGSDRLARRARSASSLFKKIILGSDGYSVVKERSPTVKLFVSPQYKVSPELSNQLDYQANDDQLVGITYAFSLANPDADVRVLTHDTGPMASAKMVDVKIAPIPDDWLLSTETSEADKTIKTLQSEINRLKATEPQFEIIFTDHNRNPVRRLGCEVAVYEELTSTEVEKLMNLLTQHFPMITNFDPPPRSPPRFTDSFASQLSSLHQTYEAPSEEAIKKYQQQQYPEWGERCERMLQNLHRVMQNRCELTFSFNATNTGTRPAKDALVTVRAKGGLKVAAPKPEDEDESSAPLRLPSPPKPPKGLWVAPGFASLARMAAGMQGYLDPPSTRFPARSLLSALPTPRDQNEFYWKPTRPVGAVSEFTYECRQWRHGIGAEHFLGSIVFKKDQPEISGVLECEIHAENLTDIATLLIPVRISTRKQRLEDIAKNQVDYLIAFN